jgi:signal transduction histidine kinase
MRWAGMAKSMQRFTYRAQVRARRRWRELGLDGPEMARPVAVLYLAGLGLALATAWHAPANAATDAIVGFPAWHLAFLMTTGAAAAMLILAGRDGAEPAAQAAEPASAGRVSELMAQMSHELRTPLNAVIGFSDVMLRELHGPLGNIRYQEYAHHISESGGRLLKSSEQALAVTEAMTALMADRSRGRREKLSAATLLRDAWRQADPASGGAKPRLALTTCATCDIVCERRPTVQALEHLFREAMGRLAAGGTVEVMGRRDGGRRSLELVVRPEEIGPPALSAGNTEDGRDGVDRFPAAHVSLRVILARLLLEVQGARLTCNAGKDGLTWSALIEFPGKA